MSRTCEATVTHELTTEGRRALVLLMIYRLRNGKCGCEIMERSKMELPCTLCFEMRSMKKEFPNEYFAACEHIANNPRESL